MLVWFWIATAVLALGVAALLALAALRARGTDRPAEAHDMEIYRDQLTEVDRDLARGVLTPEEAERARLEVSRRLLDADRKAQAAGPAVGSGPTRAMAAGVAVTVLALAFGLYWQIGAPGYPDMPLATRIAEADAARANRASQAMAEAEASLRLGPPPQVDPSYAELMDRLRAAVEARPGELEGQQLLARNEAALGNWSAARTAQGRVIEIKGEAATAQDYADYAELLIMAAGGYVSPEAERALAEVLRREPGHAPARYYSGLLYAQTGRPDVAFRLWRPLLENSPPDAPWVAPIRQQIGQVARLAGVRYQPPAASRGPSQEDIAAAAEMSAGERGEMIRGMVQRLSDRLADEGGPPEDWARLISALGVLGETDRARRIYAEARQVFGDAPTALAAIETAAESAGVAE